MPGSGAGVRYRVPVSVPVRLNYRVKFRVPVQVWGSGCRCRCRSDSTGASRAEFQCWFEVPGTGAGAGQTLAAGVGCMSAPGTWIPAPGIGDSGLWTNYAMNLSLLEPEGCWVAKILRNLKALITWPWKFYYPWFYDSMIYRDFIILVKVLTMI